MTSQDISELIERVRAATGPDRELDFLIQIHVADPLTGDEGYTLQDVMDDFALLGPEGMTIDAPYTASIDAVLALAERVLPGCVWTIEADACWLRVLTEDDVAEFQGNKAGMGGKWTPLAIVLALLTALQSTHSGQMK